MPGTLYLVATPIGNRDDFSKRGIEVLKSVDLIACEDTRVTKKLTDYFDISTPRQSLHAHSNASVIRKMVERLQAGESIAFVSDAGTPGVNDPGGKLVEAAFAEGITISPIPGASALTAAISVCGFPMEHFRYLGFAPHKKGRETFFKTISAEEDAVVFFESTHRIAKAMDQLHEHMDAKRLLFVGRELTKQHETLYRGTVDEVRELIKNTSSKGEFVLVLAPKSFRS